MQNIKVWHLALFFLVAVGGSMGLSAIGVGFDGIAIFITAAVVVIIGGPRAVAYLRENYEYNGPKLSWSLIRHGFGLWGADDEAKGAGERGLVVHADAETEGAATLAVADDMRMDINDTFAPSIIIEQPGHPDATTVIARVLPEEWGERDVPLLIIDPYGSYTNLPLAMRRGYLVGGRSGTTGQAPDLQIRYQPVQDQQQAWGVGQTIVRGRLQVVFELGSYAASPAQTRTSPLGHADYLQGAAILLAIIAGMADWQTSRAAAGEKQTPAVLVLTDALSLLAQNESMSLVKDRAVAQEVKGQLLSLLLHGNRFGLNLYVTTSTLVGLDEQVLQLCKLWYINHAPPLIAADIERICTFTELTPELLDAMPRTGALLLDSRTRDYHYLWFRQSRSAHEGRGAPTWEASGSQPSSQLALPGAAASLYAPQLDGQVETSGIQAPYAAPFPAAGYGVGRSLGAFGQPVATASRLQGQYRLNLGSHTLDLDTALDNVLILEPLPEGAKAVARISAEELGGPLRVACLVVDFTDGLLSLVPELSKSYVISSPERHSEVPAQFSGRSFPLGRGQQAVKLGRVLLHEGGQAILRFGSYSSPTEASAVLLLLLQGMYSWQKEHIGQGENRPVPCVIVLSQAHRLLPYNDAYSVASADPELARLLGRNLRHYLGQRGEFGMHFYLVTDQVTRMSREALRECGLLMIKQPQRDELRCLSEAIKVDLEETMQQMQADQVLLLDIEERTSYPVTLRLARSSIETESMLLPLSYTLGVGDSAATYSAPAGATVPSEALPREQRAAAHQPATDELADTEVPGEGPGGFSEAWLAYACYLYSTGRLTPTALRRAPDPLFDLAMALGLRPIKGQDAMNGKRAIRLVGIVQGMGKESRSRYTKLARQYAPQQVASLGGARHLGPSPPTYRVSTAWELPAPGLLKRSQAVPAITTREVRETSQLITRLLAEYDVYVEIREEECSVGHTICRYAARPTGKPKLRVNQATGQMEGVRGPGGLLLYDRMTTVDMIEAKEEDLATKLAADSVRIARVPGKPFVGIEIPHREAARMPVSLRDILVAEAYQQRLASSKVLFPLGKDVAGEIRFLDLANPDHPHLLIGGASGGGKSIFLRAGIASIAMQATPDEVRMWMVDPKMVEFTPFAGLPHLIGDIVTDIDAIPKIINHALAEVMRRYEHFKRLGVTNLEEYRRLLAERPAAGTSSLKNLPELLLIIDELGDALMVSPQEVEEGLCRLGQIGRAAGLHLVLATQRPEVKIVTGRIKANLPYRIAFRVSSVDDSKVVIGRGGAQLLVGHGDMLAGASGRLERLQGAYIGTHEVDGVVSHWRRQAARLQPASPFLDEQGTVDEPVDEPDGTQQQEERGEEAGALLRRVIAELPQKTVVSVQKIKEEYHLSHGRAQPIIEQLLEQRLIGEYSASLKGHPVRIVNLQQRLGLGQDRDKGEEEERSLSS